MELNDDFGVLICVVVSTTFFVVIPIIDHFGK